jgi:hypothetical protein
MKKIISFIFISAIVFSVTSCSSSSDNSNSKTIDTVASEVKTDTGTFKIGFSNGTNEAKATLVDANGKIKAKGMFINNKLAGAWVRYDENGNVIGAEHYSDGKPLHTLDKNDFIFRNWENQQLGFKILVPEKWVELKSPNSALLASFEKNVTDTAVHAKPNFNVARAKLDSGQTLEKLGQQQIEMYHQSFGRIDIVEKSNVTIDSCTAFRWYGMYQTETNKIGFLNVIIVSGNDAWLFSCEAQNREDGEFLKYQGVFQQIVESFHRIK